MGSWCSPALAVVPLRCKQNMEKRQPRLKQGFILQRRKLFGADLIDLTDSLAWRISFRCSLFRFSNLAIVTRKKHSMYSSHQFDQLLLFSSDKDFSVSFGALWRAIEGVDCVAPSGGTLLRSESLQKRVTIGALL